MSNSRLAIALCAMACVSPACGSSDSPVPQAPVTSPGSTCTLSTSTTFLSAGTSPSEGTPFVPYFASVAVPRQGVVYFVDVTTLPSGCFVTWTAVPSNANIVNVSPAGGNGRGRVELFVTANAGAARQATVTVAGQVATILQAGR